MGRSDRAWIERDDGGRKRRLFQISGNIIIVFRRRVIVSSSSSFHFESFGPNVGLVVPTVTIEGLLSVSSACDADYVFGLKSEDGLHSVRHQHLHRWIGIGRVWNPWRLRKLPAVTEYLQS